MSCDILTQGPHGSHFIGEHLMLVLAMGYWSSCLFLSARNRWHGTCIQYLELEMGEEVVGGPLRSQMLKTRCRSCSPVRTLPLGSPGNRAQDNDVPIDLGT